MTPLPEDDDDDFPPVNKILLKVAHPASKVAGARRPTADPKGKGKAKAVDALSRPTKRKALSTAGPLETKRQKGRATGALNYQEEDINALMDILEVRLPVGAKGWNSVADEFCEWAEENGRSARTAKSLELKYKQVCAQR